MLIPLQPKKSTYLSMQVLKDLPQAKLSKANEKRWSGTSKPGAYLLLAHLTGGNLPGPYRSSTTTPSTHSNFS